VSLERAIVGKYRCDVRRLNPSFWLFSFATGKEPFPFTATVLDAFFAAWIGVGSVVGLLGIFPDEAGVVAFAQIYVASHAVG